MDNDPKYNAVPKGQESSLLVVSTAFLGVIFAIIGGFIFKLWYDERSARRTREAYAEMEGMDEIMGTGNTSSGLEFFKTFLNNNGFRSQKSPPR